MSITGFKVEPQYITLHTLEQMNNLGYVTQAAEDGGIFIPHSDPETVQRKLIEKLIIPPIREVPFNAQKTPSQCKRNNNGCGCR
jgi:hypothetical protein